MAHTNRHWTLCIDKLWSTQLKDPINCLTIGKPFIEDLSEENDILTGTTNGRVLTLNQTKPVVELLETKGGAVQTLNLQYLTGHGARIWWWAMPWSGHTIFQAADLDQTSSGCPH
ncbi:unnamed protein product [Absidia cylindrospora]